MDLDHLRTFLAVKEHASFTRAAQARQMSQSTISFHIKSLENELGRQLFERKRDGIILTAEGETFRAFAHQVLELQAQTRDRLHAMGTGARGHLTIAASTVPAEYLLPPILVNLAELYPRVTVSVNVLDSSACLAQLEAGSCELALVGAQVRSPALVSHVFARDAIVLASADPRHLDRDRAGTAPLSDVTVVGRARGSGTRAAIDHIVAQIGGARDRPLDIELGSTHAVKQCLVAGLGVGFISKVAITEQLARRELFEIPVDGCPVERSFRVAYRRDSPLSTPARALLGRLPQPE